MRRKTALLTAAALVAVPVMAQAPANYLSQRDVAEAAKQHPQVVQEFGGAETGPRAAYVEGVGRKVAAYSGTANAGQVYHFTTLNSAVENAFAVPGGYVYITRQLMGIMNDESQLAFVLGHETGHVAARHAQTRQKAATKNSILGILGVLVGGVVGNNAFGNLISQSAQQFSKLNTLKFSREQEYQADVLGIRYMTAAGYDPAGSASMLSQLSRNSALESRIQGDANRSTPEWAQTHPLTENRVTQASQVARQTGRVGTGLRNRDVFLDQLEGVYVDDDPAQGVIDGRSFTHPDLKMRFYVPTGFLMQNSSSSVDIQGSSGQAQFSGGRYDGNIQSYVAQVLQQLTGGKQQVPMGPIQRTVINGIPAYVTQGRANTSSGQVDVGVVVYEWDRGSAYHFVTLTQAGQGLNPFRSMIESFRRITDQEATSIRPRIIDVVTVQRGDTLQSLSSRMAYPDYRLDRFLAINGLASNSQLVPGQKVKVVVYGTRRR
ncbi:M48 family metalloprotease [Sphingomonas jaspsi]|uniref:M48 family metalloprotease n=1 Tax=Sphingomonas jaspsi TaxID=392409 RepID=UPI0004ADE7F9|nr:M48 family metalloprotease [Sphingomonas jaspsi]